VVFTNVLGYTTEMIRTTLTVVALLAVLACSTPPSEPAAEEPGAGSVVRLDPAIDSIVPADAKIEKLDEGFMFLEGPVWISDGGYLLFSDVPGDTVFKWAPGAKSEPLLKPVYNGPPPEEQRGIGSNGLTLDSEGKLVLCEHGNRRIARMAVTGGDRETLVDGFEGKKLNSPNDLVYHSDGSLYFTDPPYGLDGQDEAPDKELDFNGVFRLSADGKLTVLTKELTRPNGIALSPDEKTLYVANSDAKKNLWMAYDVQEDGSIANGRVFFDATGMEAPGGADGFKIDTAGNLYCTGPGGVLIFNPEGRHLGTIQPIEVPANVAWGDADGKTLYMTARTGLYRIRLSAAGLLPPASAASSR
jgi:gluconolactonase